MKRLFLSFLELVEFALIAIGAVVLIRNFLAQPFLVNGSSMVPSFYSGDYLIVDELTYRFREPKRGEVVVFKFQKGPQEGAVTYFIKRIVALPGETIQIKDGKVKVFNAAHPAGLTLSEAYLTPGAKTGGEVTRTLGDDEYFVLGDNRPYSYDSRSWGSVKREQIVGIVRFRLWPLRSFHAFAAPSYGD
ncbi:signal peptidase I [Candidatus Parcubacteria bacterium]|nr:MAG: signal peptidase I [Candidatus Parcubacteria bacterium]